MVVGGGEVDPAGEGETAWFFRFADGRCGVESLGFFGAGSPVSAMRRRSRSTIDDFVSVAAFCEPASAVLKPALGQACATPSHASVVTAAASRIDRRTTLARPPREERLVRNLPSRSVIVARRDRDKSVPRCAIIPFPGGVNGAASRLRFAGRMGWSLRQGLFSISSNAYVCASRFAVGEVAGAVGHCDAIRYAEQGVHRHRVVQCPPPRWAVF